MADSDKVDPADEPDTSATPEDPTAEDRAADDPVDEGEERSGIRVPIAHPPLLGRHDEIACAAGLADAQMSLRPANIDADFQSLHSRPPCQFN